MEDTNNSSALSQFYSHLVTDYDQENGVMWCYANPSPRPCFTPELLKNLHSFLNVIKSKINSDNELGFSPSIRYLILGSYKPGIFSLGGDLDLFVKSIRSNDRDTLEKYMRLSIDVLYGTHSNMNVPLTTIAMIRGNALGAGFEGALACDYLVAEKSVQLGFPEVLFNMFPGMGAYSFLVRRIRPVEVEKMILSGRIYTAEELYEIGVIDYLAEDGEGQLEVKKVLKQHEKNFNTRKSLLKIRNQVNPITYEELLNIGNLWVDAAFSLSEKELRVMQRLIRSQDRVAHSLVDALSIDPEAQQMNIR